MLIGAEVNRFSFQKSTCFTWNMENIVGPVEAKFISFEGFADIMYNEI